MNRARTHRLLLAIACLGAGAIGYGGYGGFGLGRSNGPADKKPKEVPPVPVALAKAQQRSVPLLLEVTGRTEAYETVTLKSRVDGQVQAVVYAEGQRVKAGEPLLRLDPADFQAKLAQAEANGAKSQAQLSKARADLDRYVALRAKGFVSEEKVGEMRTALAAATATAQADSAASDLARLQLSYTTIKAPFAGTVGARLVFPGTAIKTNDTALAVVNRVQPLYVNFAVPEKYLPALRAGMQGKPSLRAAITLPGTSTRAEGDVRFLDNAVDTTTGTIQLKATLPNTDESLAAGQLVSVTLQYGQIENAVTIPAEAVQQGADGPFVYVVQDGMAQPRKLTLATVQANQAVVSAGLGAGDAVVTEGQLRLTPGAKVKPASKGKSESGDEAGHASGSQPGNKPGKGERQADSDKPADPR
jgi:multidrug efflux system membrane fusion protein